MKILFNGLLEFQSQDQLKELLSSEDKKTALKLIELALQYAQNNGLYSFEESYVIYNCLNALKNNE
jgi:hypothetical protein